MSHASALPIVRHASQAFRPPRRVTVADGASQILEIRQPGGYSGPWSASETPYMVEPMNALASRNHEAVCFVGPARTGKTLGLLDGWMAHAVVNDPGDMLVVQMSQEKAREFSKIRVDRAIRNSPQLKELMSARGHDDNTHDKLFRHGMWLKIGWPSASQLSSSDYRYVALTDYDRFPDNIDGEGAAYQLALKRTQTFLSRGMCMVESSPGKEWTDPHWRPCTPHEAPPCSGVIGVYNRSDRRRWYWPCPDCAEYFEASPGLDLFCLPAENELMEMVRGDSLTAMSIKFSKIACPHCGSVIEQSHKPALNRTGVWVGDGQTITRDGEVIGDSIASSIAGFWLGGVAAAYQKWDSIVLRYLQALREYALSGSELALQGTVNTDQGMPYISRHLVADKEADIQDRTEKLPRYIVPDEARFAIATADVQGGANGRFVCEVRAFGPHLESWLIDRFAITTTERGGETAQVDPSGYPEDWDLLTQKLVQATYRTQLGKELRVYRVGVDTGGEDGTTPNAYAWYRRLRKEGLSHKVLLLKGGSNDQQKPMVKGNARTNTGKKMADMPVWIIGTDYYKDIVAASIRRKVPGPGYFHPADWLPATYYDELRAETRQINGKWKQVRKRNEALDLWVYALAVCESIGFGSKGSMSWDTPPPWAMPLEHNSEMITREERRAEKKARPAQRIGKSAWSSRL